MVVLRAVSQHTGRRATVRDSVRLEGSPDGNLGRASLRLAWGEHGSWTELGQWYQRLLDGVPGAGSATRDLAQRLCEATEGREQCFEALAEHVTTDVRYEAVEIGPGGWVPSPADQVVTRGWGDCKDKSLLLHELLKARDIDSHLVLIRHGDGRAPDPAFPSAFWFNHCILAVEREATGAGPDHDIGGLVLVDPTGTEGAATWLSTGCQDRPALLIDGAESRLIEVPLQSTREFEMLTVRGAIDDTGAFEGTAELRLDGSNASSWIRYLRSRPDARADEVVTARFARLLPGAQITGPEHRASGGDVPSVHLSAALSLDNVATGRTGQVRVRLPGINAAPDPRTLDSRDLPVVVLAGIHLTRWVVELPAGWCPPVPRTDGASTEVGHAMYQVALTDGERLRFERSLQLHTSQVDPDQLEGLRELAVFDARAARRSIRLRCE